MLWHEKYLPTQKSLLKTTVNVDEKIFQLMITIIFGYNKHKFEIKYGLKYISDHDEELEKNKKKTKKK